MALLLAGPSEVRKEVREGGVKGATIHHSQQSAQPSIASQPPSAFFHTIRFLLFYSVLSLLDSSTELLRSEKRRIGQKETVSIVQSICVNED